MRLSSFYVFLCDFFGLSFSFPIRVCQIPALLMSFLLFLSFTELRELEMSGSNMLAFKQCSPYLGLFLNLF